MIELQGDTTPPSPVSGVVAEDKMRRRDFLKITAISGGLIAGAAALGRGLARREPARVQETRLLMGTIINLTVLTHSRADGELAIEEVFTKMARLVRLYDHRQQDGPLGRLNRRGRLEPAPKELMMVVQRALEYSALSAGAFDITVKPVVDALAAGKLARRVLPLVDYLQVKISEAGIQFEQPGMQITLDGIAKGAVVDGAAAKLRSAGYRQVLVEAGGDLWAGGADRCWRLAVGHPRPEQEPGYLTAFELRQGAVATSGDYMNAFSQDRASHHIIDPRSGISPGELASATVIAPTATDADALSTALMVLGSSRGLALAEELAEVEALVVDKELNVKRTPGFPKGEVYQRK